MEDSHREPQRVRITDIDMPFWSMVVFMVKWAVASIPAILILAILGVGIAAVVGGAGAALFSGKPGNTDSPSASRSLFDSLPTAPTGAGAGSAAGWVLSETKNPIDDSPTVVLTLDATSPASSRFGSSPSLILRCRSSRTELYITWNDYLGMDETRVTVRVGRAPARTNSWSLSTDNRATFYPGSPIPFIRELMAVDTLVAMATPYGESPVTAIFPVSGLTDAIQPLRTACRW